jgi:hypothetical protein
LAPSTILQFPGADHQRVLAAVVRIVRRLPCFDFALGPDPAATIPAIEAHLDGQ